MATTEKIADSADPLIDVVRSGPNRSKPLAGVLYTCIQSVAFTVLAIMIMRMKLFMTPQLCIVAGIGSNIKGKTKNRILQNFMVPNIQS